jgi:hypothetical protein
MKVEGGSRVPRLPLLVATISVIVLAASYASYQQLVGGNAAYQANPQTFVKTTTVLSPSTGIELQSTLNSTLVQQRQSIRITVSELNPLNRDVNLSAGAGWPLRDLTLSGCGPLNFPFGVQIFRGYYTKANVSSGLSLSLFGPGPYSCPARMEILYYVFQQNSTNFSTYVKGSNGTSVQCCYGRFGQPTTDSDALTISGYYDSGTFKVFDPGAYTVATGDEWGQLALLHFVVT